MPDRWGVWAFHGWGGKVQVLPAYTRDLMEAFKGKESDFVRLWLRKNFYIEERCVQVENPTAVPKTDSWLFWVVQHLLITQRVIKYWVGHMSAISAPGWVGGKGRAEIRMSQCSKVQMSGVGGGGMLFRTDRRIIFELEYGAGSQKKLILRASLKILWTAENILEF